MKNVTRTRSTTTTEDFVAHLIQKVSSHVVDLRLDVEEPQYMLKPEEIHILEERLQDIGYLE